MTIRERALKIAVGQLGVTEVGQNNWGPKVAEYLKSAGITFPAAWCMAFVHWCYERAGLKFIHANPASVGFFTDWAARLGWHTTNPQPGDIIAFHFNADLWPDHVGFVRKRIGGLVWTVEGNTSPGEASNDAKMGGVYPRVRRISRCLFVRVPGDVKYQYAEEPKREKRKLYLRAWILRKRDEGMSWKQIKLHPYGKEYYEMLGGK